MILSHLAPSLTLGTATLGLLVLALPATTHASDLDVVQIAAYEQAALQVPENLTTDFAGNVYVSLALTGEISRIDKWGEVTTVAQMPIVPFQECFDFVAGIGGITYTPWGLYVNVNSCDPDQRGIWWVSPHTGASQRIAALPTDSFANGIAYGSGHLFVSDSFSGRIFRAPAWGCGDDAEVWTDEPLLAPVPPELLPPELAGLRINANGLKIFEDEVYVSHTLTGDIVAIEVEPDLSAGEVRVHANVTPGCDDFSFDEDGALYCATNFFSHSVVMVLPDGTTEPLLDVSDGLDGPTATAFGRGSRRHNLYISNGSFPFYPNFGDPGVSMVELEVEGAPGL